MWQNKIIPEGSIGKCWRIQVFLYWIVSSDPGLWDPDQAGGMSVQHPLQSGLRDPWPCYQSLTSSWTGWSVVRPQLLRGEGRGWSQLPINTEQGGQLGNLSMGEGRGRSEARFLWTDNRVVSCETSVWDRERGRSETSASERGGAGVKPASCDHRTACLKHEHSRL